MKTLFLVIGLSLSFSSLTLAQITFTFDRSTVSNSGTTLVDPDPDPLVTGDEQDYVIGNGTSAGPFTITQSGLTLTGQLFGPTPQINDTGVFIRGAEGENVLSLQFDQPVIVESFTMGRFQFSSSDRIIASIAGPGGVGNTDIFYAASPGQATTYLLPQTITDVTLTPGVNDFRLNGNSENFVDISAVTVTVVPEPSSIGLLTLAAAFAVMRRRRQKC